MSGFLRTRQTPKSDSGGKRQLGVIRLRNSTRTSSELVGRPHPAMEPLGELVEGRDEAFLRRCCAGIRLRCEPEARVLRDRAAFVRLSRREEPVPIVAVGLDRLLQRLL